MAKWYGKVGYATTSETPVGSGIWIDTITEHEYYGDLIRNNRRLISSGVINDGVGISNEISIVADQFAYENFHSIRYIEFMGANYKVSNIEVKHPRLILTLGDVYNGQQTITAN